MRRAMVGCLVGALAGCGAPPEGIKIDGSSTVYPVSEAVAEAYGDAFPGARVTVGKSGTGGGFKKLAAGEIDICNASRAIKESEIKACEEAGVEFVRLSVAFDGIAIVVNPQNDWLDCITVDQLAMIWRPDNPAQKWSDLDPEWPDKIIKLYGPGTDSGTFDYFTKAIVGKEKSCRPDFTASEDDNVLVTGVSEDLYSVGYFGLAYYEENSERLKLLGIEQEDASCVTPTLETVRSNTYKPLSRPLFIYVRKEALTSPVRRKFVDFYLENVGNLATEVGYVPSSDEVTEANRQAIAEIPVPPEAS